MKPVINTAGWQRLKEIAQSGRMPHALLIHGPEGCGKLEAAARLARLIHCEHPNSEGEPCGQCTSCRLHAGFNHLDMVWSFPIIKGELKAPQSDDYMDLWREYMGDGTGIVGDVTGWARMLDKKGSQPQIYVSEADALLTKLSTTAHSSEYKVVVMWLPELINVACANKLLKIVEEPHADSRFIFVSNNPDELLPTLKSRCQSVAFYRLPNADIEDYLVGRRGIPPTEATVAAQAADGNVVMALRMAGVDNDYLEYFNLFASLMRLAYQRKVSGLRSWAADLAALGRDSEVKFYHYAMRMIRESFIYNFKIPGLNYMRQDEENFATNFCRFIHEGNVEQIMHELETASHHIAGNGNGKIVNFDLALRITMLLRK